MIHFGILACECVAYFKTAVPALFLSMTAIHACSANAHVMRGRILTDGPIPPGRFEGKRVTYP
jgi:hypothetical protein